VEAGADAIGMVVGVPQSSRNINPQLAQELINQTPPFITTVVVTVFRDLDQLIQLNTKLHPDALQIHGFDDPSKPFESYIYRLREHFRTGKIIGGVRVYDGMDITEIRKFTTGFDAILLDSFVRGIHGGSGRIHNWELSKQIKQLIDPTPIILAGGLTPENVQKAIQVVRPYAVDVSTGVEACPGMKERNKVIQFIKKVREVEL